MVFSGADKGRVFGCGISVSSGGSLGLKTLAQKVFLVAKHPMFNNGFLGISEAPFLRRMLN
jgi:hypothetical protein